MSCIQLCRLFWRWFALSHAFRIKTSHSDPFQAEAHIRQTSSKSFTLCLLHVAAASSANLSHDEKSHKTVVFFQPSILNFPPKSSKTKLLVSSQLRISLDDKSHSVLTVGNSHLPTPVQPNVRPTRRNEPPPPGGIGRWISVKDGAFSVLDLEGFQPQKLIDFYFYVFVRLLHLQTGIDTFI